MILSEMKKINNYICPKCGSSTIIFQDGDLEYCYTCADCGYMLMYYIDDGLSEEDFYKVWDSGKYESDKYVTLDNKVTQEVLNIKHNN